MTIRKLKNDDADKLKPFLSDYIETSMFLLSNMKQAGLKYQNKDYHGEYIGAFNKAGNIIGVLVHYWNGIIMMQAPEHETLNKLITSFCKTATRPISGVLGANDQAKTVIDKLPVAKKDFATNRAEGLYSLDLNNLLLPTNYDFSEIDIIEACQVDKGVLTRWLKAYSIEAFGSEDNEDLDVLVKNRVHQTINSKESWALHFKSKPVSLCGFNAKLNDIVQIGPVWTPTEYRNKGYARVLTAMALQKAKEYGVKKAILFTDNPAAKKSYTAIGFKKIGSYRMALLKKPIEITKKYQ